MFIERGRRGDIPGIYYQLQPKPTGGGNAEVETLLDCCNQSDGILANAITPTNTATEPVVLFIPDTQPDLQNMLVETMETYGHPVEEKSFEKPVEAALEG